MAAPLRKVFQRQSVTKFRDISQAIRSKAWKENDICKRNFSTQFKNGLSFSYSSKLKLAVGIASVSCVFAMSAVKKSVSAESEVTPEAVTLAEHPISRSVSGVMDVGDLKFTLYQFQSCPYCCKVRATLDYFGIPYDVVEVNSITKKQVKFSEYKKVPILVVDIPDDQNPIRLQFNDSSLIMSMLRSWVHDSKRSSKSLQKFYTYYPVYKEKEGRKTVWDFPNKYYIMYEDDMDTRTENQRKEERKWRRWTDSILMHTISPNVYKTPSESLEAFHHFSDWGEWEKHLGTANRILVVYGGAFVMFFVGKMVKKRHNISDDPRDSLFEACTKWTKALGNKKYLGNDQPNMADLSVYGALHSFQGCKAWEELMSKHKIKHWYIRMERDLQQHTGTNLLTNKTFTT